MIVRFFFRPDAAGRKPGDEEVDFDGLLPEEKGRAVTMLLDCLPSIVSSHLGSY